MADDQIMVARKQLREFQRIHGDKIADWISIYIGQVWNTALEKDPSGGQLKYVVEEAYELVSP